MKWVLDCFEAIVSEYYEQSAVPGTRNLWMYVLYPPIVWKLQNCWSLQIAQSSRVSRISRKYGTSRLLERPDVIRSFWRLRILRPSGVSGTSIMSGTSRMSGSTKCLEPQERPKIVGCPPPPPPHPPCLEPPDFCNFHSFCNLRISWTSRVS
jgi:hypothetical protein